MPVICADCGCETTRYTTKFRASGARTTCYVCEHPTHSDLNLAKSANNFADLTLEHVLDENGKPVHVSSARELYEAEKRYKFRSVVGHENEANFNRLPPPKPSDPFEVMSKEKKWLYPEVAERMLQEMRRNGELIEPKQEKLYEPYRPR